MAGIVDIAEGDLTEAEVRVFVETAADSARKAVQKDFRGLPNYMHWSHLEETVTGSLCFDLNLGNDGNYYLNVMVGP